MNDFRAIPFTETPPKDELFRRRWVYWVNEVSDKNGDFYCSLVFENVSGHYPTNWNWGKDYATAVKCAAEMNKQRRGYDDETVQEILGSSMFCRADN